MQGSQNKIFKFMTGGERYLIPCYQRSYSWTEEQCRTLYEDMIHLHSQRLHDKMATHFIGSIVCQQVKDGQSSYLIIDGQQRLTTMYLFYLALYRMALKHPDAEDIAPSLKFKILSDESSDAISGLGAHRFELTQDDQGAMDKLFAGNENEFVEESLLTKNYKLFTQWMENETRLSIAQLYKVSQNLVFIEIELDPSDDAQLIFESLNSKGLDLSEGDKVRNFLLMGLGQEEVKTLYYQDWRPVELNCHKKLSEFIQYYLALKCGRAPSMKVLYLSFKDYVLGLQDEFHTLNEVKIEVMKELLTYSKLFHSICTGEYDLYTDNDVDLSPKARADLQNAIEQSLKRLVYLNYSVRIPILMQFMMLHRAKMISGNELLEALKILETFLFRRWACGIPSHGLNRTFQALSSSFDPKNAAQTAPEGMVKKLVSIMCSDGKFKGASSMPNDAAFKQALLERDLYSNSRNREALDYMFERLENADSLEQVKIDDSYSIEHIMPQKLSEEWREELGPEAEEIHKTWLHRMANLTLTAYNSKYSNSSFADKRSMEHGLASSPLRLNQAIAKCEHWGPKEMAARAQSLIEKALKIWPYPGESQGSDTQDMAFDYCLAEGELDLTDMKLNGFEFRGKHYEVKKWVQLQRDLFMLVYQLNPERMRNWLSVKWGNFSCLECYLKSTPDFSVARSNMVSELNKDLYLNTNQNVVTKIRMLYQLFEMMEIDPEELILHLVSGKSAESVPASTAAEQDPETDL
ncbi:MAG: DUF262 domain-containing protein [Anaerobiospirillum sp.]|nr:DUF262 domain-containing protein [Anaerobiospirillum sp.]